MENRDECWESAWHRLHETTLQNENSSDSFSQITSAMLANVIVLNCLNMSRMILIVKRSTILFIKL